MSTRLSGKKVLAVVLAGGRGQRLAPLTDERAKPVVPMLGSYKLIDFTLSNLAHSGVQDIWIVEQYLPHGLNEHLSGGRPWDLDRTRGGLRLLPPFADASNEEGEFARGNAHALAQHADMVRHFDPDLVLVLSADHIYRLDYSQVISSHVESGAALTMVTTQVPAGEDASRFGNVEVAGSGQVTRFAYKPEHPLGTTITTEIFLYDSRVLLDTLARLTRDLGRPLGDYGEELIPSLVKRKLAYAYPLDGYWLDVGTLAAYMRCHRDFLEGRGPELDDPAWPFQSSDITRPPARIARTARLDNALICNGATVAGEVVRSVVAPGSVIEAGATVRDSVVYSGSTIRSGAVVSHSIIDEKVEIGQGAHVGGQTANSRPSVVGAYAHIGEHVRIGPGQRITRHVHVKRGEENRKVQPIEQEHSS